MKEIVAHVYANTKEDLNEVSSILSGEGYEIAYESETRTSASIIKEIPDEE